MENIIIEPTLLKNNLTFQISLHNCTKTIKKQILYVFPFLNNNNNKNILIITTLQHSNEDLVNIGEIIENEKERLLLNVILIYF